MDNKNRHQPPKWATRFIGWYCKPKYLEDLLGDLQEYFERNVVSNGYRYAQFVYIIDALKFFRRYTVKTPRFFSLIINSIMIGNYIKTSGRSLMRNKLFSFINIIGLAISMSVGLLLISFLMDLNSYDQFHEKVDRIYRVTNLESSKGEHEIKYPTTSIKTGKILREQVSGIEKVGILRDDFSGDVLLGENSLPIKGFWAESSLFDIFTFPMLEGNPATALNNPYSVVLTESAATKFFGVGSAMGKAINLDSVDYQVTGIIKDIPFFSHLKFEALASLSTLEQISSEEPDLENWTNSYSNFVFVLLQENADKLLLDSELQTIADYENQLVDPHGNSVRDIHLELLPVDEIVVGEDLARSEGLHYQVPHISTAVLWFLFSLAILVIVSSCFNYTNLSLARAMRRFKEIGLRKTIGANKSQVWQQFLIEAVMISLFALLLSLILFLIIKPQLINLALDLQKLIKLDLSPKVLFLFVCFALVVGVIAGVVPALIFAKVNAIDALKNVSSVKVFNPISFRKTLVVIQYTFTLIFITTTVVGYVQYKNILEFDLGFTTENILNINMQGNKPESFIEEMKAIPEVVDLSKSTIVTSIGNAWGGYMKYGIEDDSTLVMTNPVDENYLNLHHYELLAGGNFKMHPADPVSVREIIVNQELLRRFQIAGNNPEKAIGEEVTFSNNAWQDRKMTIVGVIKDFHYGKIDNQIQPVAFMFWTPENPLMVNAKIKTEDIQGTLGKIEEAWKRVDPSHPFQASFYQDAIEQAYSELSVMIKIIGFLSILAISIASMGLFGMVVYTTETKVKEVGIRKVMGASSMNLIYLLSRDFLWMLLVSAFIALPLTYLFFERYILTNFPYHEPVRLFELFAGLSSVILVALLMIGSQTIKASQTNPAEVLKSE